MQLSVEFDLAAKTGPSLHFADRLTQMKIFLVCMRRLAWILSAEAAIIGLTAFEA